MTMEEYIHYEAQRNTRTMSCGIDIKGMKKENEIKYQQVNYGVTKWCKDGSADEFLDFDDEFESNVLVTGSVFFIFLLLTLLLLTTSHEEPTQLEKDTNALKYFIDNIKLPYGSRYKWDTSQPTCTWPGVGCFDQVAVIHLRIPGASLVGQIPPKSLGNITSLTVLSLHDNGLSGPFPEDFANLIKLSHVYLHNNNLNGQFPSSVTQWTELVALDLSNNNFSGMLPSNLENLENLETFNVSNNNLRGRIPQRLAKLPEAAFSGNLELCGEPLSTCDEKKYPPWPSLPSKSDDKKPKKKLSTVAIVAIAIGSAFILLILFICLGKRWNRAMKEKKPSEVTTMEAAATGKAGRVFGCGVKEKKAQGVATMAAAAANAKAGKGFGVGGEAGTSSSKDDVTGASMEGERNKLVFFEGGVYSFNLEDLLRASAELLGKGSAGTWYKTVLQEGTTVVVKRLKDVVVSKKEFDGVMEGLGKMKNENVVPIRAYYYSKDEKLLVCDYFPADSLFALLHVVMNNDSAKVSGDGSGGSGQTPLDWDHRFRIALSAARGVAYLHVAGKVVHGNIKSSNILLRQDSNKDAYVSDFGLNTLFGGSSSPNIRVTGYCAPEVLGTRKVTFKSDVYSFGVLLLELLTGKAPNQVSLGEEGIDLPRWVQSVVREEWTVKVFDVELMRYQKVGEEMVQLLQIAMPCISIVPDQRPPMQEVVRMMEDMNRDETDDGMRQSSDDPSKGSDGHTPPTESRNSPNTVTP
ncbi:leucine-rich repeat protein kinase family protein [Artemisia annua]|uniref:Leucine-rich repeat protein kinase family protein n=1 Tax=Artemisia annua TaxID=35608 RepID=A0A2U1PSH4_ARTAN|nr:leucine-rich repeat protein kinase family protein [Artemisia annua]